MEQPLTVSPACNLCGVCWAYFPDLVVSRPTFNDMRTARQVWEDSNGESSCCADLLILDQKAVAADPARAEAMVLLCPMGAFTPQPGTHQPPTA